MKIIARDKGIVLEWKLEGREKKRKSINRFGNQVMAHATIVKLPYELVKLVSNDETYTYIYEHFETICMTPNKPPEEVTFKKTRLVDTSSNEKSNKTMEIPKKFLETASCEGAIITYHPTRKDYISGKDGLFTIDTYGDNFRKHIKRTINSNEDYLEYETYLYQTNAPEGVVFHEDLKEIFPNEIYVYSEKGKIYLTPIQPNVECIETTEEDIEDDLFKHHFIDANTEKIYYFILFKEKDIFTNAPKVIAVPVGKNEDAPDGIFE